MKINDTEVNKLDTTDRVIDNVVIIKDNLGISKVCPTETGSSSGGGASDGKVSVISSDNPDYLSSKLGPEFNNDGSKFYINRDGVTIKLNGSNQIYVDFTNIDHDQLLNFVQDEHRLPDNTTITVNGSGELQAVDNYIDSLSFNTSDGVLTATRGNLSDLTVDLDGRYIDSESDPIWTAEKVNYLTTTEINALNVSVFNNDAGYITSDVYVSDLSSFNVGNGNLSLVRNGSTQIDINFDGRYILNSEKGSAGGVATLGTNGLIPVAQLPSYIEEVQEYANVASFPAMGSTNIIYIALDTNKQYRWSGTQYAVLSPSEVTSFNGRVGLVSPLIGDYTTELVTEAGCCLYFTEARSRASISATGSLTYDSTTGIIDYVEPTTVSTFANDAGYLTAGDVVDLTTDQIIGGNKTFNGTVQLNSGLIIISGGTNGYILTSDSAGNASWQPNSGGHDEVTVSGEDYLSIFGQAITASQINLASTNVTGILPITNGGTGINNFDVTNIVRSTGTSTQFIKGDGSFDSNTYAQTSQLHDAVTIAGENYASLSGQQITFNDINLATNVTGTLADGSLSSNVALLNAANTFTQDQIISKEVGQSTITSQSANADASTIYKNTASNGGWKTGRDYSESEAYSIAYGSTSIPSLSASLLRLSTSGNLNLVSGSYQIGGTTVIDAARKITSRDIVLTASALNTQPFTISNPSSDVRFDARLTSGDDGVFRVYNNLNSASIVLGSNGDSYFDGGNVGFGDVTPSYKIDVNGDVNVTSTYKVNGTTVIDSSRNISGGSGTFSGKINIGTTTDEAEKLNIFNNIAFETSSLLLSADNRNAIRLRGRNNSINTLAISARNLNDYMFQVVSDDGLSSGDLYLNHFGGTTRTGTLDVTGNVVASGTVTATNVFRKVTQTLSGTSPTYNCSTSVNARITLTGNTTMTLTNLVDGMSGNIRVTQDTTGGRTLTLSPTPDVINGGGGVITLTGTAGSVDIISWWYDGINLNVTYGQNYN